MFPSLILCAEGEESLVEFGHVLEIDGISCISQSTNMCGVTPTTNSKQCPYNIINVQNLPGSLSLSVYIHSPEKMNEFAQGGREPVLRLDIFYMHV